MIVLIVLVEIGRRHDGSLDVIGSRVPRNRNAVLERGLVAGLAAHNGCRARDDELKTPSSRSPEELNPLHFDSIARSKVNLTHARRACLNAAAHYSSVTGISWEGPYDRRFERIARR